VPVGNRRGSEKKKKKKKKSLEGEKEPIDQSEDRPSDQRIR
jgi:hypothetical protein